MRQYGFFVICLLVVAIAGTGWAGPYRILHKQGAIYNTDTGWTMTTPPYYPGSNWTVDMVSDSQGVTILHKDGALWQEVGGWDMSTPPYYPGSAYAQALDAGPEEVRIPISSLPYTITQSGSYYITGDLTSSSNGIQVMVNHVTIDLMGYSIRGTGSGYGIFILAAMQNVEVRNGTITLFGDYGIYASASSNNLRVIEVRTVVNGGSGIYLEGKGELVKDCTASKNGSYGIYVGNGSTVTGNTAYDNGSHGIFAEAGSTVTVNTAYYNENYGIALGGNNLVNGNTAYDNNQSGGSYKNISDCANCTWGLNHNPAIP